MTGSHRILTSVFPADSPRTLFLVFDAHCCVVTYLMNKELRAASSYAMLCYAKSLQSCPTLCDPIDGSPPGFPVPRILQARTLEWVSISFSHAWKWKEKVKSLSSVWLLVTPWTNNQQKQSFLVLQSTKIPHCFKNYIRLEVGFFPIRGLR